ncbi:MAG: VWA domain-containing protein, partial [Deltaproteobacteria bacterium]|nr:VWA domain-containing protein [Deltaproteobacteria bacterium]
MPTGSPATPDDIVPPMGSRLVEFVQRLRALGIPIGVDQAVSFAESFACIQPLRRGHVYHAARATLVNRHEYLGVFDRAFTEFWEPHRAKARPQKAPQAPRHRPEQFHRPTLVSFMAEKAQRRSKEIEVADRRETATEVEWLQRKDFANMTEGELRALRKAMVGIRWNFSQRLTHRLIKSRRGRMLDHRETLRRAARLGGVVAELRRRDRKEKARPLIVIADISGSMELYSRIVLQFFHGLSQQLRGTESFVFGTRLTHVTDAFALRHVDVALDAVSSDVADFAGGTRIAESLHTFRHIWGPKLLRRGVVVLVVSDGCETGDVQHLKREVQALQRSCYRLIWLNPRLGHHSYQPKVRGMAAVLPYVDDFLP